MLYHTEWLWSGFLFRRFVLSIFYNLHSVLPSENSVYSKGFEVIIIIIIIIGFSVYLHNSLGDHV